MSTGDRLDFAMRACGFKTQADLAHASGVPQPTISRILKGAGIRGPESETIRKLADACKVNATWLLSGQGDPKLSTSEISAATTLTLMYVTQDEIEILTAYRLAPEKNKEMMLTASRTMPRDKVALEAIKDASKFRK